MIIAIDTETCLFRDGLACPPLVCLSYAIEGGEAGIISRQEAMFWIDSILYNTNMEIVGHNFAYDASVLCAEAYRYSVGLGDRITDLFFKAYDAHRIHDTQMQEQLIDLSEGMLYANKYNLEALAKQYLGKNLDKENSWRKRYGELIDVPISEWPDDAIQYPKDDALSTRDIFFAQRTRAANSKFGDDLLFDGPSQACYEFTTRLMGAWGLRTDADKVQAFESTIIRKVEDSRISLVAAGILEFNKKTGKYVKKTAKVQERVIEATGTLFDIKMTEKGSVATDRKVLDASKDSVLKTLGEYVSDTKLLSTYVKVLKQGTEHPINASFRLVETGRRGATKNMQTAPRNAGTRECYVPRKGYVFCSCDYDSVELRTWAQIMSDLFGGPDNVPMAVLYRANPNADPHTKCGAEVFLKISYEEGMKLKKVKDAKMLDARQKAKALNFGFPGGLGAATFVEYARGYGYETTESEAKEVKKEWMRTWHAKQYFDYISKMDKQFGAIVQHRSMRIRGFIGSSFCAMANTLFQGLAADGAYKAGFKVSKESYTNKKSPLYGSRVVNVMHDEIFMEMPEDMAHDASVELSRLMNDTMQEFTPDIPITTSPALMRAWSKKADSVFKDGKLIPWEDREIK